MSSVGQVIGGAIGFFLGGPMGAQIGMMVGGMIDPPKGPTIHGPRLNDLSVQTSTYGAVIPRVYGTMATRGNVFWLEKDRIRERTKKKKMGGKGGGGQKVKTYTYFATFAVGLCKGPIAGVRRVWVGSKLIYDARSDDLETIIASNQGAKRFRVYLGTDTQEPDPRMQADKGVANTPAYRGLAYLVFYDYPLKDHGNSLMGAQVKVEVVSQGSTSWASTQFATGSASNIGWKKVATNGDGVFVAVRDSSDKCLYSRDGKVWVEKSMPYGRWFDICWTGVRFVAVGIIHSGLTNSVAYSNDGINWTGINPPGFTFGMVEVEYGKGVLVAARVVDTNRAAYSLDHGETWTLTTLPSLGTGKYWSRMHFNGSVFCVVTDLSSEETAISNDGKTWALSGGTRPSYAWRALTSDDQGKLVTVARSGGRRCAVSVNNGATWEINFIGVSNDNDAFEGIHWNGKVFIVTSGSGPSAQYHISSNGYDWVKYHLPSTANITAITSMEEVIIALSVDANKGFHIYQKQSHQTVSLSSIVQKEALLSKLVTVPDLDVSELTDQVRGYRVSQVGAIRGGIEPLQAAWPFDVVQQGYQLKFRRRPRASVVTIPADHLDARAGDTPGVEMTIDREMDSQLPREVALSYLDVNREYE